MIGLVWATEAGRRMALGLAEAWPRECTVHDGPVREQLVRAWSESTAIVAFLATGAVVRLVAPLLGGKRSDPGVVCVDEGGRFAVALLGGHEAGANLLAERVAEVLGAQGVVTTATDSVGFPGLDVMGFKVGNPERLASVSRAMLDGLPVAWLSDDAWPVPAMPPNVGDNPGAAHAIRVTDRRQRLWHGADADAAGWGVADEGVAGEGGAGLAGDAAAAAGRGAADEGAAADGAAGWTGDAAAAAGRGAADEGAAADGAAERADAAAGGVGWRRGESVETRGGAVRMRGGDVGTRGGDVRMRDGDAGTRGGDVGTRVGAVADSAAGAEDGQVLVLHPPSLVLGIGASRGVSKGEIAALVHQVLADAGLAIESVRCIATADIKAAEAGLVEFAEEQGWPIVTYPAAELAAVDVPHPSEVVREAVGTPSVSEAAALLTARTQGREASLIVPKTVSPKATVAVARLAPRGRLAIVGLGPGAADLRTPKATTELRRAAIVVGLDQYVDQIRHLLRPGTRVVASGLGAEEERARSAVELAREGNAVALIGSGDAGIYAMASPALEFATEDLDIHLVPGVTAALAASSLLGAPLGHDHAYLSLSDLHTPWPTIERRLHAAAESDLVVCLYNPRSTRRTRQLPDALAILSRHRPPHTPVGLVRNAFREGQRITRTTLATLDPEDVDMNTVVIVGSTTTHVAGGRMITPRGYRWK